MIPEYKTLFLIFSIILYNNDEDLFSVLPNNFKSLLNILVSDFSVVVVDSNISYRGIYLFIHVLRPCAAFRLWQTARIYT